MNQKDYYKIIGVNENAEFDEIKKAYRNLAFLHHPDRATGSEDMMKEINEAYAVLSNPAKRKEYDTMRQRYGSQAREQFRQTYTDQDIFRDSDISQIFEEFSRVFGFSKPEDLFSGRNFYGPNYRTFEFKSPGRFGRGIFFHVPLRNAYRERPNEFHDQTQKRMENDQPLRSKFMAKVLAFLQRMAAKKLGLELPERGNDLYDVIKLTLGEAASGGKTPYLHKKMGQSRHLLISVPPGITAGQKIKLKGVGQDGKNGGEPGDLYLKVKIRTPIIEEVLTFFKITQHTLIFRSIISILYNLITFGGLLFIPAGTLDWWRAWVFIGVVVFGTAATMFSVFPGRDELLNERFKSPIQQGQPLADKIILLSLITTFFGLIAFIPIDVFRYHIIGKPGMAMSSVGMVLFVAGWAIISFAFKENPFAAPVIKHQEEQQQKVIDTGVYRIVRHPMYTGGILLMIGMPLWLESYAATLLTIVPIGVIILRILIEEQFLKKKLMGYGAYMKRIRYRIIPFLW